MGLHLREGVELPVVVLHRVHVVVRSAAQEDGRGQSHQDDDTGYLTDQHQPIFNRIGRGKSAAASRSRSRLKPETEPGPVVPAPSQRARRGRMSSGMSLRSGLAWSRVDRMGSLTPQSAPTAGSFQARPNSSAGS
jgi:hypothetical protein